jgi:hypothetical protein
VWSFVWRKFSSVGNREYWDEIKYGQKLKLGNAHVTPRNIQEVQALKLGDAPEAPLLRRQKSVHLSTHYIFIASYSMRFSIGASLFSLLVFFYFVCCNKWLDHIMFVLERDLLHFSLPRTLYLSLLSFNECSLFLELCLAFVFRLDFYSDLILSLHQGVFIPLFYVGFHQKSCFKKVWMLLEKRKSFMQKKVVQKEACLDRGLDFCMPYLMSFW